MDFDDDEREHEFTFEEDELSDLENDDQKENQK